LNAQKNLPASCRQQFHYAITNPTKEDPAEVSVLQSNCNLCSSLWIMEYIPKPSRGNDDLKQDDAGTFHGTLFRNEG
jgi:hypothetical protein